MLRPYRSRKQMVNHLVRGERHGLRTGQVEGASACEISIRVGILRSRIVLIVLAFIDSSYSSMLITT